MEQQVTYTHGLKKWLPLIVLSFALTIIILDTTILNVSLRTIINDLHTNIQSIQWVVTAYSLMLAAFTVTGGRLGDIFGRKKLFVLGAIIFAFGSFMTSISHSVWFMVLGEAIIEGIGASLMLPATSSLLVSTYTGRDRQIAFGVWGGIAAGAAALGPVIGGWLTTYFSWRWAFRINVGIAAILVLSSVVIKEMKDDKGKQSLDIVGVLLSALGLLSIVFGFIESSTYGWIAMKETINVLGIIFPQGGMSIVPIALAFGTLMLLLFALWEQHMVFMHVSPLVSLSLFKNKQFSLAVGITAVLALGQSGLSFATPVFLQTVRHLDAFHTGIAMLPMSATLLLAAPFGAVISKYIYPKYIIQAGLFLDALGFLALIFGISVHASTWELAPGFMLFGIGMGFMMSQASNLALSAVPVEESGQASGVNGTLRTVGQTLGTAIMGAILISSLSANLVNGVNASTNIPDTIKQTVGNTVSSQASSIEFGSISPSTAAQIPQSIAGSIQTISQEATVDATHTTLAVGIVFIILAMLVSTKLPKGKQIQGEKSKTSEV